MTILGQRGEGNMMSGTNTDDIENQNQLYQNKFCDRNMECYVHLMARIMAWQGLHRM